MPHNPSLWFLPALPPQPARPPVRAIILRLNPSFAEMMKVRSLPRPPARPRGAPPASPRPHWRGLILLPLYLTARSLLLNPLYLTARSLLLNPLDLTAEVSTPQSPVPQCESHPQSPVPHCEVSTPSTPVPHCEVSTPQPPVPHCEVSTPQSPVPQGEGMARPFSPLCCESSQTAAELGACSAVCHRPAQVVQDGVGGSGWRWWFRMALVVQDGVGGSGWRWWFRMALVVQDGVGDSGWRWWLLCLCRNLVKEHLIHHFPGGTAGA